MTETRPNETIIETIWRGISAPIVMTWALASFLPLFAFFGAADSAIRMIVEATFLATGFAGAFGLWVFMKFAGGEGSQRPAAMVIRGQEKAIRSYAACWLAAYIFYGLLRALG